MVSSCPDDLRVRRITCALAELGNHHSCTGIPLGRLENKGVACHDCHGYAPERNHTTRMNELRKYL